MNGEDSVDRLWGVGELARATGLTVRTLHHYDDIALVQPSERTQSGHRRYTEADVRRLYRVRALRSLGLSLPDIAKALSGGPEDLPALREVLAAQLDQLDTEARRVDEVRAKVRGLLEQLSGALFLDQDQLLALLETMTMVSGYYNEEQQEWLAKRAETLGPDAIKQVEAEWSQLYAETEELAEAGVDPADERAQRIVTRMDELVVLFHDNNAGIKESLTRLWSERGAELRQQFGGPSARAQAYLEEIRKARGTQ